MENLIDYLMFFAKMVGDKTKVESLIKSPITNANLYIMDWYDDFTERLAALPNSGLLPGLKGFYFSFDEDGLKDAVAKMKATSPFLIVEFPVEEWRGDATSREISWNGSIGVYHDFSTRNNDKIMEVAIMCECKL